MAQFAHSSPQYFLHAAQRRFEDVQPFQQALKHPVVQSVRIHQSPDQNLSLGLSDAVNTTDALLDLGGIPRQVVVNDQA